jgi:hypothetical protein
MHTIVVKSKSGRAERLKHIGNMWDSQDIPKGLT